MSALVNRGRVLDRAMDLLDVFIDQRLPLSAKDICARSGLERRICYRYLEAFEQRGIIERVHDANPRRLGQLWRRGPRLMSVDERAARFGGGV